MVGSSRRRRRRSWAPRLALAGLAAVFIGAAAQAQFLPGAAPPGEIAERLRANGYYLIGPLRRKDTVYLADVAGGDGGRQRLVIDAWSGEILQRFVARPAGWRPGFPGGYVMEGGEFDGPPPLGPPPKQDFLAQPGYAYGEPTEERKPPRSRPAHSRTRQRPAALTRPTQPLRVEPANPPNAPSAEAAKEPGKPEPSATPAPPPPTAPESAKRATTTNLPTAAATSAAKPGEKAKPNDVPVNPLE